MGTPDSDPRRAGRNISLMCTTAKQRQKLKFSKEVEEVLIDDDEEEEFPEEERDDDETENEDGEQEKEQAED